jgi:hypothetical protein
MVMKRYIPSITWTIALTALFFMDTSSSTSFCIFKLVGFDSCRGCGIGHSIHFALHFQFREAVHHHLLGIPSALALTWLIIKPFIPKHTPYESTIINDAGTSAR